VRFPIQAADAENQRQAVLMSYTSGPVAFILKRGLLRFGLVMFVVSTLYIYFVLHDHKAISWTRLEISAPLCLLLGLGWGTLAWFKAQSRNKQLQRNS
jgi:hypothetical protein